jgi:hypothetical protein
MTSEQLNQNTVDSTNLAADLQKSSLETHKIEPVNDESIAKADKFKEEGNAEFKSINKH